MEKNQEVHRVAIEFKPVNDGLGFHPFADGLPYAPVVKPAVPTQRPTQPQGSGAIAAGRPIYSLQLPRVAVKVADRARPAVAPTPLLQPISTPAPLHLGFAFVLRRCFASLIDLIASGTCALSVPIGVLLFQKINPLLLLDPQIISWFSLFVLTFSWSMLVAQEVALGSSIGKWTMNLRLVGNPGSLFTRALLALFSLGLVGLGLVWALFDSQKRTWHDLASGTQLVPAERFEDFTS